LYTEIGYYIERKSRENCKGQLVRRKIFGEEEDSYGNIAGLEI
jgi:hypothetical protein